jgi:hypothetical protein
MQIRILDLDGSISQQSELINCHRPAIVACGEWAPHIRLACSFRRFWRFEADLAALLQCATDGPPTITLYGSGDFHHVSLALLRRQPCPINVLVLDNHPDWMRGIPFLHCGTWLFHAAYLPHVHRVFHVGGEVDFDNYYRWLAPWSLLERGKITVLPAFRTFRGRRWAAIAHSPVRRKTEETADAGRLQELLAPFVRELGSRPLYISLDKDVMQATDAIVNWDSGRLTLAEVQTILTVFTSAVGGNLAGMDIVGDWSPVRLRGWLRRFFHLTEHPRLTVDRLAALRNQSTNLALVETILGAAASRHRAEHVKRNRSQANTR